MKAFIKFKGDIIFMQNYLYYNKFKVTLLLIAGLILSFFLKSSLDTGWTIFLSDMFFSISVVFFIYGMWEFVLKSGFFNGLIYGTGILKDLIFSKNKAREDHKEDYVEYIENQNKRYDNKRKYDSSKLLIIGLFFLIISILVSFIIK